jgi:hypothetical protein
MAPSNKDNGGLFRRRREPRKVRLPPRLLVGTRGHRKSETGEGVGFDAGRATPFPPGRGNPCIRSHEKATHLTGTASRAPFVRSFVLMHDILGAQPRPNFLLQGTTTVSASYCPTAWKECATVVNQSSTMPRHRRPSQCAISSIPQWQFSGRRESTGLTCQKRDPCSARSAMPCKGSLRNPPQGSVLRTRGTQGEHGPQSSSAWGSSLVLPTPSIPAARPRHSW